MNYVVLGQKIVPNATSAPLRRSFLNLFILLRAVSANKNDL